MGKTYILFASVLLMALVGCQTRWVNPETGVAIEYEKKDGYVAIGQEKYEYDYCAVDKEYRGAIDIPETIEGLPVKVIHSWAFHNSKMSSITISNGVTEIGSVAFAGCSSLTSITLPNSVTKIGSSAFKWCNSLNEIVVGSGNAYYSSIDGILYTKYKDRLIMCPQALTLTSVTIPNGVTEIGEYAFAWCSSLKSITIPNSVTKIGESAFDWCSSLKSITIPNSVTKIGESAFRDCSSLECVFVDKGQKDRISSLYNFDSQVKIVEIDEWNENIIKEGLNRLANDPEFKVEMIFDQIEAERKRLEAERRAKEEAERKERERLEAERRAKEEAERKERLAREEAERKERERLEAERLAREEAEHKERERLEAERKARELQEAIDKVYAGIINEYWNNHAAEAYNKALKGECANLSEFIQIAAHEGVAIIEAFADEKMPNAAGAYEKAKERAMELQQIYNEEFPVSVNSSSDKYSVYCKLLDRLSKARTAYHRAYKELAHYYFHYKFGIITQDELTKIDEKPILIDIIKLASLPAWPSHKTLGGSESQFAAKYMPESFATYQLFLKEYDELSRVYAEAQAERAKSNAFLETVFEAAYHKGKDLAENIDKLTSEYIDLCMQHRIGDKDSEELAKIDHERAEELKNFAAQLPTRVKEETNAAIENNRFYAGFSLYNVAVIPGCNYKMQKTEVTQCQWKAIMGNNPSHFKGDNLPVERVSWNDCQEFIKRLNQTAQEMGLKVRYRLPTEEEWEYCCRAGSKGYWGKRANGQEGPLDAMGWYGSNSGRETHPVARKEPNAWGLYDMHGNVWEWTSTARGSNHRVCRGGSCYNSDNSCRAGSMSLDNPDDRSYYLGFRLISEDL